MAGIWKRCWAFLLSAMLLLPLCACGGNTVSGYCISNALGENNFSIAFRTGDQTRDYVNAALQVLMARGTVRKIAAGWFTEDPTMIEPDETALDAFQDIPKREFIMGLDPEAAPMSYAEGKKSYAGFDVELAQEVCKLLGWKIKYQEITPGNADVELSSGNIDAAWGGMSFEGGEDAAYSLSDPYMKNDLVLVSRADSKITSLKKLRKKVLYTTTSDAVYTFLTADEKTFNKIGEVVQCETGAAGCMEALSKSLCDAVLMNSVSAGYYIK